MGARVFRRGELQTLLLQVVAELGEAHGYAVMHEVQRRVGRGWRASPGAIYPALMRLVDAGLLASRDVHGTHVFRVTEAGSDRIQLAVLSLAPETRPLPLRLGALLDAFAREHPDRACTVRTSQRPEIEAVLLGAAAQLSALLEGDPDGRIRTRSRP